MRACACLTCGRESSDGGISLYPALAAASFDLSRVYVHLGLGARAGKLPDFTWSEEYLRRWHTADVHEPGSALFITPGRGTEHRPR